MEDGTGPLASVGSAVGRYAGVDGNLDGEALLQAVGARAAGWFDGVPGSCAAVRESEVRRRPGSQLHILDISFDGEASTQRVAVKVVSGRPAQAAAGEGPSTRRPRLLPLSDGTTKHGCQYAALVTAERRFSHLDDERVSVNHALGHIPEHLAVIVEYVDQPTLRDALQGTRLRRVKSPTDLLAAFHNAGLWLRQFHADPSMHPSGGQGPTLRGSGEELLDALRVRVEYLENQGEASGQPRALEQAVQLLIGEDGLGEPPMGPHHGDYSPRNMFVDPQGRITVFDLHGQWLAPMYEDVSFFLASLRTSRLQVLTQGNALSRKRLAHYESAFLKGYFGATPIPLMALAPYETLIWLDRWAGLLWHWSYEEAPRVTSWGRRQALSLCNRYFGQWAHRHARWMREGTR